MLESWYQGFINLFTQTDYSHYRRPQWLSLNRDHRISVGAPHSYYSWYQELRRLFLGFTCVLMRLKPFIYRGWLRIELLASLLVTFEHYPRVLRYALLTPRFELSKSKSLYGTPRAPFAPLALLTIRCVDLLAWPGTWWSSWSHSKIYGSRVLWKKRNFQFLQLLSKFRAPSLSCLFRLNYLYYFDFQA